MKIEIKVGMKFQHVNPEEVLKGNKFEAVECDYFDNGEPILCANYGNIIYPLTEIVLTDFIPMIDGKWINELNEYVY